MVNLNVLVRYLFLHSNDHNTYILFLNNAYFDHHSDLLLHSFLINSNSCYEISLYLDNDLKLFFLVFLLFLALLYKELHEQDVSRYILLFYEFGLIKRLLQVFHIHQNSNYKYILLCLYLPSKFLLISLAIQD